MGELLGGIFVGGASRRMGGRPKGLLVGPDGRPLVERSRAVLEALGAEVVLVGASDAYAHLDLARLPDDPPGVGPLGGLAALLAVAGDRKVLAVACDMPFIERGDLSKLLETAPEAAVVAPRRDGRWEPLCARYAPTILPVVRRCVAERRLSLMGLLDDVGAVAVTLPERHLDDWDRPEDINAS